MQTEHDHNNLGPHPLRASSDALDALHALLAESLLQNIAIAKKNGYVSSRLLSVACAFLKLAGITSPASSASRVDELIEAMPDFDKLGALPEDTNDEQAT